MNTRHEVIAFCLTLPDSYEDYPFHDANWTVMRYRKNNKGFAFVYKRDGRIWINVKCSPIGRRSGGHFLRNASVSYEQTTLELHHFGRFHGRSGMCRR
ncbi:MAG: MmcQ/YjbR family DNA-binding protein [Bianqueaceae bacterium]